MLKGVVTDMHCLALLSFETGLVHPCLLFEVSGHLAEALNPCGLAKRQLFKTFQKPAPWIRLPHCDVNRGVMSPITRQPSPQTAQQTGWDGVIVAVTSTLGQSLILTQNMGKPHRLAHLKMVGECTITPF